MADGEGHRHGGGGGSGGLGGDRRVVQPQGRLRVGVARGVGVGDPEAARAELVEVEHPVHRVVPDGQGGAERVLVGVGLHEEVVGVAEQLAAEIGVVAGRLGDGPDFAEAGRGGGPGVRPRGAQVRGEAVQVRPQVGGGDGAHGVGGDRPPGGGEEGGAVVPHVRPDIPARGPLAGLEGRVEEARHRAKVNLDPEMVRQEVGDRAAVRHGEAPAIRRAERAPDALPDVAGGPVGGDAQPVRGVEGGVAVVVIQRHAEPGEAGGVGVRLRPADGGVVARGAQEREQEERLVHVVALAVEQGALRPAQDAVVGREADVVADEAIAFLPVEVQPPRELLDAFEARRGEGRLEAERDLRRERPCHLRGDDDIVRHDGGQGRTRRGRGGAREGGDRLVRPVRHPAGRRALRAGAGGCEGEGGECPEEGAEQHARVGHRTRRKKRIRIFHGGYHTTGAARRAMRFFWRAFFFNATLPHVRRRAFSPHGSRGRSPSIY